MVEDRFNMAEKRIDALEAERKQVQALKERLKELELKAQSIPTQEVLEGGRAQMEASAHDLQRRRPERRDSSCNSRPASAASTASAASGRGPRLLARIVNLGWDSSETELCERARECLRTAGVEPEKWAHLHAAVGRTGVGSAAELWFHREIDLEKATTAIRAATIYYGASGLVWLGIKKAREELKAARAIHRAHECIGDVAKRNGTTSVVYTKHMGSKTVKRGHDVLLYIRRGTVAFMAQGVIEWAAEERRLIADYAEDS